MLRWENERGTAAPPEGVQTLAATRGGTPTPDGVQAGAAQEGQAAAAEEEVPLRDMGEVAREAEIVAEQLELVADDVKQRFQEDDLLPTIGDRGAERRERLRGQVAATSQQAERLVADTEELQRRAVEAQEAADEAERALMPPEPEEGAQQPDGLVESEDELEWPPKELVEKFERLTREAKEAAEHARRTAKASERSAAAVGQICEACEATEAEVKRREDAAVRVARFWRNARELEAAWAIIWLHGQGESEQAWQTKLADVKLPERAGFGRWIWPRAELQACSTRGGVLTPQWFDTPEFPIRRVIRGVPDRPRRDEDPNELSKATTRVHAAIEALEAEGLPSDRIVLAGSARARLWSCTR